MSTTVADIDEALAHASRVEASARAGYVDRLLDERLLLRRTRQETTPTPTRQALDSSHH